jgi:hypothetical protein
VLPGSVVLVHSPLVSAATWGDLPAALSARVEATVLAPAVPDDETPPQNQRFVSTVARDLHGAAPAEPIALVAHSGAGALLPMIGAAARAGRRRIGAYVFLDAMLPLPGAATRLDTMAAEDAEWTAGLRAELESGDRFPAWTDESLSKRLPLQLRRLVLTAMRPKGLDFFLEQLPQPDDWPDAPCGYLRTSDAYDVNARRARARGWPVQEVDYGHFPALTHPTETADLIAELLRRL